MKGNMKKIVSIAIVLSLVAFGGITMNNHMKVEAAMEAAFSQNADGENGEVNQSTSGEYVLSGVLTPIASYTVSAAVIGKIKEVLVANGDEVATGDVLIRQDPSDALLQAGNGSTIGEMMERLKLAYDTAEENYQKNEILFGEGAISQTVYKQSLTQRDNAKLQYEGTSNSVAQITNKTVITSPGNGIVTGLLVKVGDSAGAGTLLTNIVNISKLQLKGSVPEQWLSSVSAGMKVELYINSLDETLQGELTYISPVSVASGQMFPVEITIDNSDGRLKAGMACSVKLMK